MIHFDQQFVQYTPTVHHDTYPAVSIADHRGHAVLISGASRGIGRAIALAFAKGGADAIAIVGRSNLESLESEIFATASDTGHSKPSVLKLHIDITDEHAVKDAATAVRASFGRLDILVNNAGRLETLTPILESDAAEWWKTFEVNVRGTYLMMKSFLDLLLDGGLKTVVTTSSIGALMQTPTMSSYQITKSALLRLSDFLISEYGDQGILAFCIHPGAVVTDLIDVIPASEHGIFVDNPRLCGDTVAWLTEKRREWLSGRLINVTWDMPELVARKEEIVQGDKLKMKMAF